MICYCVAASAIGKISWVEQRNDSVEINKFWKQTKDHQYKTHEVEKRMTSTGDNDPKHTSKSALKYLKRHILN